MIAAYIGRAIRGRLSRLMGRPWLGWALALLTLVASFLVAPNHVPGGDFRNRIVGARALAAGLDPYDLAALKRTGQSGMPTPALMDPRSSALGFSATTASPATLTFYRLFTDGNWWSVRRFWLSAEWGALVLGVFLVSLMAGSARRAGWAAFLIIATLGFSLPWTMHVYLGQYYIFPALLLCGDLLLVWRAQSAMAGLLTGLAAAFRPTVLVVAPALWIVGQRRAAAACLASGICILGASVLAHPDLWAAFSRHTQTWVDYYASERPVCDVDVIKRRAAADPVASEDGFLEDIKPIPLAKCASMRNIKSGAPLRIKFYATDLRVKFLIANLALAAFLASAGWMLRHRMEQRRVELALLATLLPMTDATIPVREEYNSVMVLPAVGFVVTTAIRERRWGLLLALGPFALLMLNMRYYDRFGLNIVYVLILALAAAIPLSQMAPLQAFLSRLGLARRAG